MIVQPQRFWPGQKQRASVLLALASAVVLLVFGSNAEAASYVYVTGSKINQYKIGAGGGLAPLSPATVDLAGDAIAVRPDGKSVYVTNSAGIHQFTVGPAGQLSAKSPAIVAGSGGAGDIALSSDGRSAYVASGPDGIGQYNVDKRGRLTPKTPRTASTGGTPSYVAVNPNGRSVYATSSTASGGYGHLSQFDVDARGRVSPKTPSAVQAGCGQFGLTVSPNGRNAYVSYACAGGAALGVYDIASDGSLSQSGGGPCYEGVDFYYPHHVAITPDGRNLYAQGGEIFDPDYRTTLCQFDVAGNGALSLKDPPWIMTMRSSIYSAIAVSPDGRSVYSPGADAPDGGIDQFDVGTGGVLAYKNPVTVAGGGGAIAVTPGIASVRLVGKTMVFQAAPGARDNLEVSYPSRSTLRVTDRPAGAYMGSPIHAGAGCTPSGSYTAKCTGKINRIKVLARDLPDRVVNSTGVPSSIYGGPGADILSGGFYQDAIYGGPDGDTMRGMSGNDQLYARDLQSDRLIDCDGGTGAPGRADDADLDKLPKDPASLVKGCETKIRH